MKWNAAFPQFCADFSNRVDATYLVSDANDADQDCVIAQRLHHLLRRHTAILVYWQQGDIKTLLTHFFHNIQNGMMFNSRRDDVLATSARPHGFGYTTQCQIV